MSKIVIANLKMNLMYEDIQKYNEIIKDTNLIVAPSYIYMDALKNNNLCSQDGYYEEDGAFTGEVSFKQLKSIGVKYSLIGHSERRHIFNETNEIISKKIDACIKNDIIPVLCVGETKEERESGKLFDIIKMQIESALNNKNIKDIIIAYEPVWSIGTGIVPSVQDISNMHKYIKEISSKYKKDISILYGGSVKLNNAKEICDIPNVDGVLVGGASLDPNNIVDIIKSVN